MYAYCKNEMRPLNKKFIKQPKFLTNFPLQNDNRTIHISCYMK